MGRHDDLPLTPLSLAILLALLEGELHGYGIIKTVEAQASGQIRPGAGSLYAALDRMMQRGWLDEHTGTDAAGEPQRRYAITRAGRAVARAELERLDTLVKYARDRALLPRRA